MDRRRSRPTARGRGGRGHAPEREGAARGARSAGRSGAGRVRARGRASARPDHHRPTHGHRSGRTSADASASGGAMDPCRGRRAPHPPLRPRRPPRLFDRSCGAGARGGRAPLPARAGRRREPGAGGALAADGVAALRRPGVPAASVAAPDPAPSSIPRRRAGNGTRDGSAERRRGHRREDAAPASGEGPRRTRGGRECWRQVGRGLGPPSGHPRQPDQRIRQRRAGRALGKRARGRAGPRRGRPGRGRRPPAAGGRVALVPIVPPPS